MKSGAREIQRINDCRLLWLVASAKPFLVGADRPNALGPRNRPMWVRALRSQLLGCRCDHRLLQLTSCAASEQ
jgi:hypothetical protein